jgi:hypothetical protein
MITLVGKLDFTVQIIAIYQAGIETWIKRYPPSDLNAIFVIKIITSVGKLNFTVQIIVIYQARIETWIKMYHPSDLDAIFVIKHNNLGWEVEFHRSDYSHLPGGNRNLDQNIPSK